MATVRSIIEAAGRKIGLSDMVPEELADGLEALNSMLAHFSAIGTMIPAVTREQFTTSSGVEIYTVGEGGAIDTEWPDSIEAAVVVEDGIEYPIRPFSAKDYAYTGDKTDDSRPLALYYERTYPLGRFLLWPAPDAAYTIKLYSKKPIGNFTSYSEEVELPPEYHSMIVYNLAVELAPEFGIDNINQIVMQKAVSTAKTIKRKHCQPVMVINTDIFHRGTSSSSWLFNTPSSGGTGGFTFTFPFTLR